MRAKKAPKEVETLAALAERFAELELHEAASVLKHLAAELSSEAAESGNDSPPAGGEPPTVTTLSRELDHRSIDANHFLGLARLYADRGAPGAAVECLQMAKEKAKALPAPYKLHARILFHQRDFQGAARELSKAKRFNPFDREVAELLGEVEYERHRFRAAMSSTIDAFLLVSDEDSEESIRLRRRIRTLKRILDWDNRRLISAFHDRQQRLGTAFERLQWRRDLFLEEMGLLEKGLFRTGRLHEGGTRIAMAGRLRQLELWSHLPDEAIFRLTQTVEALEFAEGNQILAMASEGSDLYFLERGRISIERLTSSGTATLRTLEPGDLLGEENFILATGRWADAVACEPSQLLKVEARALKRLMQEAPYLSVQIYSSFWHALARKLRTANELLRSIFSYQSTQTSPQGPNPASAGDLLSSPVQVDSEAKIQLFAEQGLSRRELVTLATFTHERHLEEGAYLFREGDAGKEMYAILDGEVRISKFFPGAGEEALSILKRGDFFGELSLIDGQPRSADAQAHQGPVTVLALDQDTINEVVGMDPRASLDFVQLLCRLLASRLKEIDERLVMWQILTLHGSEQSMPAFPPSS